MKILMTADAVGGVWTYALEMCRALQAADVQIVLATMGPEPSPDQREAALALSNVRLVTSTWRLEWMEQPWEDVSRAGDWLLEMAERESVDLIHLNGYSHAQLNWNRPVLVVAHSCVCSWWESVHGAPAPKEWDRYRENVSAGLAAADCVVAPTHAFLETLQGLYGALPRTRVIHNGRSFRMDFTEEDRLPAIFACGRTWDGAKNLRLLDRAGRSLRWNIYVAGSQTSPDGRTHPVAGVQALGVLPQKQVERWLSRSAIFAHPALYEPFGLAVLEAAAHGCALVLSDVPTLRELWDGAAWFASPFEPVQFRSQLARLIDRPAERRALSVAARERASRFTADAMGSAYAALYSELFVVHRTKELAVA